MPKLQTLSKPSVVEKPEESDPPTEVPSHLTPIPNHPLAEVVGSFRDSVFFEEVLENIRARREEEIRQFIEKEENENPSSS